mgnify:CR=1 FL=1
MTSDSEIKRLIRLNSDIVIKFTYPCGYTTGKLRWVCSECESIVGYPREEEIKSFLKK